MDQVTIVFIQNTLFGIRAVLGIIGLVFNLDLVYVIAKNK
jgi:hypothetical protein